MARFSEDGIGRRVAATGGVQSFAVDAGPCRGVSLRVPASIDTWVIRRQIESYRTDQQRAVRSPEFTAATRRSGIVLPARTEHAHAYQCGVWAVGTVGMGDRIGYGDVDE